MSTEKQYIQAFNKGYMLCQHEPDITNILTKILTPCNNYLKGFFDGGEQKKLEKSKHHLLELEQLRG